MSISSAAKPYTFANGTKANAAQVNSDFDTVYTSVNSAIAAINTADGSKSSLGARLDVSINADGTLKDDITSGGEWINPELSPTYVGATSFTVSGDQTDIYLTHRVLRIVLAGGTIYRSVVTSTYAAGTDLTTVTVATGLTDPITSVEHGTTSPWTSGVGSVSLAGMTGGYTGVSAVNLPSFMVARDGSGNFAAGTITANLTGNVTGTASLATNSDTVDSQHAAALAPPGAVTAFAMSAVPSGWLECNGAAVSRSTYVALFGAIGTTWGSGNGSTTFNVPDLRGQFIRGWDHSKGVDTGRTLGSYQADDNKPHNHFEFVEAQSNAQLRAAPENDSPADYGAGEYVIKTGGSGDPTLGLTSASGTTESRPRNYALMYCIKT